MKKGKIKFYNEEKGFGFIIQDEGSDLFFHVSETNGQQLKENDEVEYEVGEGRKGPCAVDIKLVN